MDGKSREQKKLQALRERNEGFLAEPKVLLMLQLFLLVSLLAMISVISGMDGCFCCRVNVARSIHGFVIILLQVNCKQE
jgi:hypothetical protein